MQPPFEPLAADALIVTVSVKSPFFEYWSWTLTAPVTLHVIVVEPFTVKVSPPFGEMTRAAPMIVRLIELFQTAGVSLSTTRTLAVVDAAEAGIVQAWQPVLPPGTVQLPLTP